MQLFTLYAFAQSFNLSHNGTTRNYILHLPSGYSATNKYPLLLNFHGLTSNASQQQAMTGMDGVSNTNQFIVVYPNGLNNSWNAGVNNREVDDIGFINTLLDALIAKYSIDNQKVYSTGFSMGGYFSYTLACKLSNRIAAIAPVSGVMAGSTTSGCAAVRPVPVAHFHGTEDGIVSYSQAAGSINYWRNQNKCTAAPQVSQIASNVELTVYGGCAASSEVRHYKITGAGHTYPRASSSINASQVMWDFLKRFSLNSTTTPGTDSPTISITSPTNNASFPALSAVTITANATVANGSITKVDFFQGSILIGSDLTTPYSITVNNLNQGAYVLTAKATSNTNISTTSAPINITVGSGNTSDCAALPSYSLNGNYVVGSTVKRTNNKYECKSAARCNGSAWAYAPGSGAYWQNAWILKSACTSQRNADEDTENFASMNDGISVSPNPAEDVVTLNFMAPESAEANITVSNMLSIPVYQKTLNANEGLNIMELDLTNLPSGMHIVAVKFLNETLTKKIFVK